MLWYSTHGEAILMSTHFICFYREIRKIILQLSFKHPPYLFYWQSDQGLHCLPSCLHLLDTSLCKTMWASSWENVSSGGSNQVRLKLACSATEASMRLEILVTETRDITLSRQQTTKALIRLRGYAGWSALLLFAYDIRHVFSWPGSCSWNFK